MKYNTRCRLFYSKAGSKFDDQKIKDKDAVSKADLIIELVQIEIGDDLNTESDNKTVINILQDIEMPDFFSSECYGVFVNAQKEKLYIGDKCDFKLLLTRNPQDPNVLKVKVDETNLSGSILWKSIESNNNNAE